MQAFEHRHHSAELFLDRHGLRARPRRLAADVDDRRALLEQAARARNGIVGSQMHPSVSEAVGSDVDDPHHRGAPQTFLEGRTSH